MSDDAERALTKARADLAEAQEPLFGDGFRLGYAAAQAAGYIPQALAVEICGFLTAAGYGKPGTANTLWSMVQQALADLAEARRLLEVAREALRPFAEATVYGYPDWFRLHVAGRRAMSVTIGDCRAAARALAETAQAEPRDPRDYLRGVVNEGEQHG